jgi:hypothetical protein
MDNQGSIPCRVQSTDPSMRDVEQITGQYITLTKYKCNSYRNITPEQNTLYSTPNHIHTYYTIITYWTVYFKITLNRNFHTFCSLSLYKDKNSQIICVYVYIHKWNYLHKSLLWFPILYDKAVPYIYSAYSIQSSIQYKRAATVHTQHAF